MSENALDIEDLTPSPAKYREKTLAPPSPNLNFPSQNPFSMKLLLTIISLFIIQTASANYLLVSRNGNLRADPSTDSEILEKIHTGDTVPIEQVYASLGTKRNEHAVIFHKNVAVTITQTMLI
jgi:hypothetical protein